MLKYIEAAVVMAEVPDEITLAINITGCPIHCSDCHSKYLWEDTGIELNQDEVYKLIDQNKGITCVAFMGGDSNPEELNSIAFAVKCREDYPYKTAWYSGKQELDPKIDLVCFDYIKLGPYIKEKGPLNCKTTNQRFYEVQMTREVDEQYNNPTYGLVDITEKFWK